MDDTKISTNKTFLSMIMGIYVLLVGMGLPIIVRDSYFDILSTKYYFYWISTAVMIAFSLIYFIAKKNFNIFNKGIASKLLAQDYAVILFF